MMPTDDPIIMVLAPENTLTSPISKALLVEAGLLDR